MSEYFSQTLSPGAFRFSDGEEGKKTQPTDPFEIGWVDLYSDKKKEVIKRDDKLREENYKFAQERYENNITPRTINESERNFKTLMTSDGRCRAW